MASRRRMAPAGPFACAALPAALLGMLLSVQACSYREIRYELAIEDPPPGGGGPQQARVTDRSSGRQVRADRIGWRFSGVLAPGPTPGTFMATGPGTGSIEAEFLTPDGTRTLSIALAVAPATPSKALAPPWSDRAADPVFPADAPLDSVPSESALPSATPTTLALEVSPATPPSPPPILTPVPREPGPGDRILEAYRLAGEGRFVAALEELERVRDPAFGPKVQALTRQWSASAALELASDAERLATEGRTMEALVAARRAMALSPPPGVRQRLEAIEKRLAR